MVKDTYPLRRGYIGTAPPEIANAIRIVITDFDGKNWDAVRHHLELHGVDPERLNDWTLSDIRQRFVLGQKRMIMDLGGTVATHTGTITPTKWNTIEVTIPSPDDSNWPTISEAARRFNENKGTVSRWIKPEGLRDNGKHGTERRIDPASILEYCAKHQIAYNVDFDQS
jgi:hypothetical protein